MTLLEKISKRDATITIIGLGYVGLPTALAFSKKGFNVIGLDIEKKKIDLINKGICPINDKKISNDLIKEVKSGKFIASNDYKSSISISDVILLVVPTPVNNAKEPDLSFVKSASESISKYLKKGQLVILESTVYPGVTEEIVLPILEKSGLKTPEDFGLAYCPERFNPGDSAHTVEKVVRVIGAINKNWTDIANALYSNIQKTFATIDIKTAEAAKVIENTQRDLNIALINEIALICEKINIDVIDVIEAASTKWNFIKFLPGPGVGGHCLPHDPYYLVKKAKEKGYHARIILAGRNLNDEMPLHVRDLIIKGLNVKKKSLNGSNVLIFGASYKKNIDDLRTSPTEILVNSLVKYEANLCINEPYCKDEVIFNVAKMNDISIEILCKFDVLVFMAAHDAYNKIDYDLLRKCIKENSELIIIDGARMFDGEKLMKMGYVYLGIGDGKNNSMN